MTDGSFKCVNSAISSTISNFGGFIGFIIDELMIAVYNNANIIISNEEKMHNE